MSELRTDRHRIADAFNVIRRTGYYTRMNFSCCASCASYDLAHKEPRKPYVFWHRQSNDAFDRDTFNLTDVLYLHWGRHSELERDPNPAFIVDELKKQGVNAFHDGHEYHAIAVLPRTWEVKSVDDYTFGPKEA